MTQRAGARTGDRPSAEPRLTIVCGHQRSGTTMLRQLMNTHPEVMLTMEFRNFTHLGAPLHRYADRVPVAQVEARRGEPDTRGAPLEKPSGWGRVRAPVCSGHVPLQPRRQGDAEVDPLHLAHDSPLGTRRGRQVPGIHLQSGPPGGSPGAQTHRHLSRLLATSSPRPWTWHGRSGRRRHSRNPWIQPARLPTGGSRPSPSRNETLSGSSPFAMRSL